MKDWNVGKTIVAAGLVMFVLVVLVGWDVCWSYWRGVQGAVKEGLRDATSIEFDLVRLDQAITDLTPTIQSNKKTAAELDIEIECLQQDTDRLAEDQETNRKEMQLLRDLLVDEDRTKFEFDGRLFTRAEVEEDLLRRLEDFQAREQELVLRRGTLSKRKAMLAGAMTKIRESEHLQRTLAHKADSLNAELRLLEVAARTDNWIFNRESFAKAQDLAQEIDKRIRTLQKLHDETNGKEAIPVEIDRRTAGEQYDEYFAMGN